MLLDLNASAHPTNRSIVRLWKVTKSVGKRMWGSSVQALFDDPTGASFEAY